MRLLVQIPCFNEAHTLPHAVAQIPRQIPGVESVEVVVVDDGSTDGTAEVARRCGADHVICHRSNRGLAEAFKTGLDHCLRVGADIIVNTDGDCQYPGADVPRLIEPILLGNADVVIGDRRPAEVPHFSPSKRLLQRLGGVVVRRLSGTDVPDAVSGFRAFSREAAFQLNVVNSFSYTIETVMQIGNRRLAVAAVPVGSDQVMRRSRLFHSVPQFLRKSAAILVRSYTMYRPMSVFAGISLVVCVIGIIPVIRFLYFFITGDGSGHIQSLVLGSALLCIGAITMALGLLGDLIACNRQLIETTLEKVKRMEALSCATQSQPSDQSDICDQMPRGQDESSLT